MPYFRTLDNTGLYYEVWGEGRPLVFVHGWSGSHELAMGMVKRMKETHKCVIYSHRGHGASERPGKGYTIKQLAWDLRELITYLGLKDYVLIGHSMGAYVVYEYINRFGCEDIYKLVVIDMSPKVLCDKDWRFGAYGVYEYPEFEADIKLCSEDISKFLLKFWKKMLPEYAALPQSMDAIIAQGILGTNIALPLLALWHNMFTTDYRPAIPKITRPLLYILPGNPIYPRGAAQYIKQNAAAKVRISEYPGLSHMCIVEKPKEIAVDILRFINVE